MTEPRYRRHPDAFSRQLPSGEAVILHPESDEYLGLNEVGAVIWEAIDDAAGTPALVHAVGAAFPDASAERVADDVASFLGELARRNLIVKTS